MVSESACRQTETDRERERGRERHHKQEKEERKNNGITEHVRNVACVAQLSLVGVHVEGPHESLESSFFTGVAGVPMEPHTF